MHCSSIFLSARWLTEGGSRPDGPPLAFHCSFWGLSAHPGEAPAPRTTRFCSRGGSRPPGPPRLFPGGAPAPPDLPCVSRMGLPPPRTPPGNSDCRKHVKNKCPPNPGQGGQCMATDIITADSEPEVFPEQAQIGIASDVARPTSDGFREPWQAGHCVHP